MQSTRAPLPSAKRRAFSFGPVYAFVSNIAHIARGQERQTIVNAVTAERPTGMSPEWNARYEAAIMAILRDAVSRSFTH